MLKLCHIQLHLKTIDENGTTIVIWYYYMLYWYYSYVDYIWLWQNILSNYKVYNMDQSKQEKLFSKII